MCSCLASCCGSCCGTSLANCGTTKPDSRLPYAIILFLGMIGGALLRYYGEPWAVHMDWFNVDICTSEACYGFGAAYRMSFTLFVFFFVHALLMLTEATMSAHQRFWVFKVVLLFALFIVCYWIPNGVFDVYSQISRFVSAIFLLLQIIILIDFAYEWNTSWTSEERDWRWGVLGVSLVILGCALTLLIFCFKWYDHPGCDNNKFFMGFTIALTSVALLISVSGWAEHGALLPSAVIILYSWWLAFSAMASDPSPECNRGPNNDKWQLAISMVITAVAVCYASISLSNAPSLFGEGPADGSADGLNASGSAELEDARAAAGAEPRKQAPADATKEMSAEDRDLTRKRNLKFHLVMSAASMYTAMIFTNWGFEGDTSSVSSDLSSETVWIKIVAQWVTLLLYIWTLIAPQVCTSREF